MTAQNKTPGSSDLLNQSVLQDLIVLGFQPIRRKTEGDMFFYMRECKRER
jgi:hypothetical protein